MKENAWRDSAFYLHQETPRTPNRSMSACWSMKFFLHGRYPRNMIDCVLTCVWPSFPSPLITLILFLTMLSTSKLRGDELHVEFIMAMADGWDEITVSSIISIGHQKLTWKDWETTAISERHGVWGIERWHSGAPPHEPCAISRQWRRQQQQQQ